MEQTMITGKDLMEWGMKPGPIFKTALKVLAESKKGYGKPQVEVSFKMMLHDPNLFIHHDLLAPIAQVMIAELQKKVEKKETAMNAKGCPITIFGEELIEPGAIRQIHVAAKLPISIQAACMPDAHEGYGLPIGGVLATDGAVIPFAVGVDIGCFTGETGVALADGRSISFLDMVREQSEGVRHFGFSRMNDNSIVVVELKNARQTRTVNCLIEVGLDNGTSYRCTEDHVHYDVNGRDVAARDLRVGQSLLPLYVKTARDVPLCQRSYSDKRMKLQDYGMVYNPSSEKYDYIHFLADEFNLRHGYYDRDSGQIRHHVDFIKTNNNPTNIRRVGWKDHFKIHSRQVAETNRRGTTGFRAAHRSRPDLFSKMGSENMRRLHADPKFASRRDVRAARNISGYNSRKDENTEQYRENGIRGTGFLVDKNKSESGRRQSSRVAHFSYRCPVCDCLVVGGFGVRNHAAFSECKGRLMEMKLAKGSYCFDKVVNHKVVSVRRMEVGSTPVYCLSEEENENFALANGVFVHNCRMQMSIFDFPGGLAKGQRGRLEKILMEQTVFGKGVDIDCKVTHPVLEHEDFDMGRVKGLRLRERAVKQIGTSGGGNHFVEFGIFEHPDLKEPKLAVLSHSGSRGVGFAIANLYTKIAMEKRRLPGDAKHLAWLLLTEDEGIEYWRAMELAGDFARACHYVIHRRIERALGEKRLMTFENHHNFAWKERLDGRDVIVHRKGATPAGKGVSGLIPGSMSTPTYLVVGKGNEASMSSSSHGAGRAMSRKEAKERYTMSQLRANLEAAGVTLIGGSVDECSMVYKSITDVMEAQRDLVEIRGTFNPLVVRMSGDQEKTWESE